MLQLMVLDIQTNSLEDEAIVDIRRLFTQEDEETEAIADDRVEEESG